MTQPVDVPDDVRTAVEGAARVVALTGAGTSAESGLATFRSSPDGLWSRFRPEELATPEAWRHDRDLVWAWYQWRTAQVLAAEPNAGHRALAAWPDLRVVTQNVDDLHERAGSGDVLHLHGSLLAPRCEACGRGAEVDVPDVASSAATHRATPPACEACGEAVRPGVVWFGEPVPAIDAAVDAVVSCDLLLVVGTSGLVHPAAGLADLALGAGATVVEINPEAVTGQEGLRRVAWRTTAATGLPALLELVTP